jgi:phosphoribosylformylglycinamidine (FGAM) synthase-like amidotransferase family enzyme
LGGTIALSWMATAGAAPGAGLRAEVEAALREEAPDVRLVTAAPGAPLRADAAVITGAAPVGEEGAARAWLRDFADAGGSVLGIGPGVAVLCAAELLPGHVAPLAAAATRPTHVRVEGRATPFTWAIPAGRVLGVEAGAVTARLVDPDPVALESAGRVILRYCDAAGGVEADSVAGVCDGAGRVVGLFPGATALAGTLRGSLGRQLLASLRLALAGAWR